MKKFSLRIVNKTFDIDFNAFFNFLISLHSFTGSYKLNQFPSIVGFDKILNVLQHHNPSKENSFKLITPSVCIRIEDINLICKNYFNNKVI
jgi:hypothetical protein